MAKKLIMSCMAVVAFAAFVLPAAAMAENKPTLVEGATGATVVEVGKTIVGTNTENTVFTNTTGGTLVTCTTAHMTGKVEANAKGTVEGTISSATFSGTGTVSADNGLNECTGSFGSAFITVGLPLCIRSTPAMATDEFQVGKETGAKTCSEGGAGNVTFTIGSTTAGECVYEHTGTVKGDFTTSDTASVLTVRNTVAGSGSSLVKGGFLCPTSGVLDMKFALETDVSPFTAVGVTKAP
jgi:hypothetical protein